VAIKLDQRTVRSVTVAIAVVRCGIGAALVARPAVVGRFLAGPEAASAPAQILLRSLGIRDLVLGIGTLTVAARKEPLDAALATGAASDGVDAFAMVAAATDIGVRRSIPGLVASIGTMVTQLVLLVAGRRSPA
jgi:hypothetical protein